MFKRVLITIGLLAIATPGFAENLSPIFGSSTQYPVIIAINPESGLPVASADLPQPVVATAQ